MQAQQVMIITQAERRRECSNNCVPRVLMQADRRRESSNVCVPRCKAVKQGEVPRCQAASKRVESAQHLRPHLVLVGEMVRQPVVLVVCVGLGSRSMLTV